MTDEGFVPTADSARAFRDALGQFATGVTLVTTEGPSGPTGFTANSFSSLSIDPPLVLWSVARSARRFPVFATARHFAIHVLAADQDGLIARFGREGPGFSGLDHQRGAHGVPLIPGALARFECELHTTHEGGDHLIVVGRVMRALCPGGRPLVFAQGRMGRFASH
ncbi:flavin reductase family protein [Gemmobacter denitrificans]|uniref:Flavin reductase family protein n=1 Tax=Gemmobacter denitrificans TaxID=3123040 RepID=A0ABU8BV32_9RHOB